MAGGEHAAGEQVVDGQEASYERKEVVGDAIGTTQRARGEEDGATYLCGNVEVVAEAGLDLPVEAPCRRA